MIVVGAAAEPDPDSRKNFLQVEDRMYGIPAAHSRRWSSNSKKYNMANVRIFQCMLFCS